MNRASQIGAKVKVVLALMYKVKLAIRVTLIAFKAAPLSTSLIFFLAVFINGLNGSYLNGMFCKVLEGRLSFPLISCCLDAIIRENWV